MKSMGWCGDRFLGCARVLVLGLVAAGCSSTPPETTTPMANTCTPGTSTACSSVTCAPGVTPVSVCSAAATFGPCMCPGAGAAGRTGGTTAPAGGTPGGVTSGRGGVVAGTPGGPVAGTAAVGGNAAVAGTPGLPTGGTTAPAAPGGSWPMMGYDTNNNYNNVNEKILSVANAPMLKEKWRASVTGFPPGTPIIAEGRVYVHSSGAVTALGLADGKVLWKRTDLGGTSSLAYSEGFIYVHTNPADLFKLNPADGTNVWGPVKTFSPTGCDGESSPIVALGMVFVGHSCGPMEISPAPGNLALAKGGVEAFDIKDGKRVWTYLTVPDAGPENGAMVWSTVTVDIPGKMLFAATGNNYSVQGENSDAIHAVDVMTGKRMWKKQVHTNDTWSISAAILGPDTDFGANPILAEVAGKQVVANGDKGSFFYMFDRKTGEIIWSRNDLSSSRTQANGGVLMNGGWDGKQFYVVSNQPPGAAILHALNPADGKSTWKKNFTKLTWGAPAIANGVLVVPSDDDIVVYNATTGDMLAMFNTGGTIAGGSPAIVDGHIVVNSGLAYELDPTVKPNMQTICYAVPDAVAAPVGPAMPTAGSTAPAFTPGSPTWSAVFEEIIVGKGCNGGPSCHASIAGGNLVLLTKADSYTALVGVKAMGMGGAVSCATSNLTRVVPGDPTNSLLLDKVANANPKCGGHMPPGSDLPPAMVTQLRDWIMAGAKND